MGLVFGCAGGIWANPGVRRQENTRANCDFCVIWLLFSIWVDVLHAIQAGHPELAFHRHTTRRADRHLHPTNNMTTLRKYIYQAHLEPVRTDNSRHKAAALMGQCQANRLGTYPPALSNEAERLPRRQRCMNTSVVVHHRQAPSKRVVDARLPWGHE
jgi:hypothetical protein